MEFARSGGDDGLKENKRSDEHSTVGDDDDGSHQKKQDTIVEESPMNNINTEKSIPEGGTSTFSAKKEEVDEQLETTKAEMGEVREENQRLKMCLNKIMNEYRVLQMKFQHIVKQETTRKPEEDKGNDDNDNHQEILIEEPEQLVSLSLGRVPRNDQGKVVKAPKPISMKDEEFNEDLTLGLDCKFETSKSGSTIEALPNDNNQSPTNSSAVPKEEAGETWPPSKAPKTVRDIAEDEVSQQNPAKKARVCVRARCDTPTMNDGCQWRKYGQKIAKGNPCPRAYYRCTVAPSCPVRKQVQRCAEDMSILITTYEGTHNHPLPLSATAMASTTSAAASMLLSGSSTSNTTSILSTNTPTTTASNLHGLNLYLPQDASKSRQIYLSNPALSSSASHPTITLDLTSNPSATSSSSSSPFVRFSSNYNQPIRYPSSTSLSFSSSSSELSNNNAMSWSNNINGLLLNYGTHHQPYNNNNSNIIGNVDFGRQVHVQQPMENFYQSIMQKNNNDTIAAATKAITADPTFQSALAAALSSFIGGGSNNSGIGISSQGNNINQGGDGEYLSHKMKWAELFPGAAASSALASTSSKVNNNGCASSFLNKTMPVKAAQNGSLMFLPPSLPFSAPESASTSPGGDNRDNNN